MANILMSPTIAQMVPGAGLARTAQLPVTGEASFAQHLERWIQTEQGGRANFLGAAEPLPLAKAIEPTDPATEVPVTVEAVLQQLMVKLQEIADQPGSKVAAGQWTFQLQDMGLLEKLATQAGMDATGLAALKKQLQEQDGLPLADLFTALEKNFKELGTATKVTVAETYLPLLGSLLEKVGVGPEVIQQLDSKGVNGLDQLDLIAYLQGLQAVPRQVEGPDGPPTCVLSPWELEQLSAMLTEAGVPAAKIEAMFPEQMPLWQKALSGLRPEQGDTPVTMSLDRLTTLLQQAVAAVSEARPQVDPAGFFNDLGTILTQAGFKSSDVGWSPVVQGTMQAAYDALQELVNQGQGSEGNQVATIAKNAAIDQTGQDSVDDSTESAQLAALNQQRAEQVAPPLADAIAALSQGELEQLAAMLSEAGVPAEKVAAILQPVQIALPLANVIASLSQGELEQLAAKLSEAGVPSEKVAAILQPVQVPAPVTMTIAQLTNLLQQASAAIDEARPQADPIELSKGTDTPTPLQTLFAKVEGQPPASTTVITTDELEQFAAMLGEANVPTAKIAAIIPETMYLPNKDVATPPPSQGTDQVTIPLPQLTALLQQALAAIEEVRPQTNPSQLAEEQATLFSPTGLTSGAQAIAPVLTPVIVGPMKTALDSLPKVAPPGQSREEKSTRTMAQNEEIDQEWQLTDSANTELATLSTDQESGGMGADSGTLRQQEPTALTEWFDSAHQPKINPLAGLETKAAAPMPAEAALKTLPTSLHLAPELQQLTVEQISQGVLRALKNNEHHLTMTLYPKELGEVKVDIQMRGSQLSASFVMENQKVKEAMESNMGEFKDNLERRGFSLGAMSVSVGEQNNPSDSRQRFVAAWEQMQQNQGQENKATPGASPLEFMRQEQTSARPGGISVFV